MISEPKEHFIKQKLHRSCQEGRFASPQRHTTTTKESVCRFSYLLIFAKGIYSGREGKEGDIPVDGDLVGGIRWLIVQITLVGGYVLGVLDPIGSRILPCRVWPSGKESRQGTFGMRIREPALECEYESR